MLMPWMDLPRAPPSAGEIGGGVLMFLHLANRMGSYCNSQVTDDGGPAPVGRFDDVVCQRA